LKHFQLTSSDKNIMCDVSIDKYKIIAESSAHFLSCIAETWMKYDKVTIK